MIVLKYLLFKWQETNNHGLPSNICMECFEKFQHFHQFREQIRKNDQILRNTATSEALTSITPNSDHNANDEGATIEEVIIENTESTLCIVCQTTLSSNRRLQSHLIRKHSVRSDHSIGREHKCGECEKVYSSRANLIMHERTHSGIVANRSRL